MAGPGGREVGRVSIRVVPDTSRTTAELKAALDEIEARTSLHISTELDTSGLVEHAKAAVAEANAAAGKVHIETEVDKSGLQQAERGLRGLVVAALLLGPALIPLGAALVGAFFPLLAILTAASAGVGAFAAVLVPQLAQILKARKEQTAAEEDYNKATTNKDRAKALAAEKAALAGLSPAQLATSRAMDSLGKAFTTFQKTLAPAVLPVFSQGLDLIAKALPALTPFAKVAAEAFSALLDQLAGFGKSAAGKGLLDFFASQVGPAIVTLGQVVGNVFVGLAGLMRGFAPLIAPIERSLVGATAAFANFGVTAGSNAGFQSFLGYIQKVGPQVVAFLAAFVKASVKLVQGLAPIGGVILTGITSLLNLFANLPVKVVTALGVAILGIASAMVVANTVSKVALALEKLQVIGTVAYTIALNAVSIATKIWAAGQWLLNAALTANPIGLVIVAIALLVAGIILAWKNSETFRAIVTGVWIALKSFVVAAADLIRERVEVNFNRLKAVASAVWNAIADTVRAKVDLVLAYVRGVVAVVAFVRDAFNSAKDAVANKLGALVTLVSGLPGRITGALGDLGHLLYDKGREIIQGLIDGITSMVGAVGGAISKVAGKIAGFLPGSPVKEGPLTVLNNGHAGGLISQMVADGITGNLGAVHSALSGLGVVGGGAAGAGSGPAGHTINIHQAQDIPTVGLLLQGLAAAEALNFSPAT